MHNENFTDETIDVPVVRLRENQFDFIHDSQKTFKTLMLALAFPGIIRQLDALSSSFPGLDVGFILQPFLTLLDLETTFYVNCQDGELQEKITHYLEINTNSQSKKHPHADFILCLDPSLDRRFLELKKGTLSQPNKSATVFYLVDRLEELPIKNTLELSLIGPGIKEIQSIYVSGLALAEIEHWNEANQNYPMGIDIYLVSRSGNIIGIPRSVRIETAGDR
jgi:alpha-D-ribose 1-methylphosphonate 5-triphosphate synthase subunit PhnH